MGLRKITKVRKMSKTIKEAIFISVFVIGFMLLA